MKVDKKRLPPGITFRMLLDCKIDPVAQDQLTLGQKPIAHEIWTQMKIFYFMSFGYGAAHQTISGYRQF